MIRNDSGSVEGLQSDEGRREGRPYPRNTPIAIIERGSMPNQRVVASTLGDICEASDNAGEQRSRNDGCWVGCIGAARRWCITRIPISRCGRQAKLLSQDTGNKIKRLKQSQSVHCPNLIYKLTYVNNVNIMFTAADVIVHFPKSPSSVLQLQWLTPLMKFYSIQAINSMTCHQHSRPLQKA
jgi:hypothetical protein